MRRFLSWCTLILGYVVLALLTTLAFMLVLWILDEMSTLSAFLRLVIIFLGGTFILGVFLWPMIYGSTLLIAGSEAVCPTKSGRRYIIIPGLLGLNLLLDVIMNLVNTGFSGQMITQIYMIICMIILMIHGRAVGLENKADREYEETQAADEARKQIKESIKDEMLRDNRHGIPSDALNELKTLYDSGVITETEFEQKKKNLLGI